MQKLDEVNSKHSMDSKDLEEKYEDEIRLMKEQMYKL